MDEPFLLSKAQMRRIEPFFPLSHGVPKVDDRRIISAIIYVIKHGLMWRDAPRAYGWRIPPSQVVPNYKDDPAIIDTRHPVRQRKIGLDPRFFAKRLISVGLK